MRLDQCSPGLWVRLAPDEVGHPLQDARAQIRRVYAPGDAAAVEAGMCPFAWPGGLVRLVLDNRVKWGCRMIAVSPTHIRLPAFPEGGS